MRRVFNELTPECEITARMYAQGYEKEGDSRFEMQGCEHNKQPVAEGFRDSSCKKWKRTGDHAI